MSLEPQKTPDIAAAAVIARGREIFTRETCVSCHALPNYTAGKPTVAEGFTPPPDDSYKSDIVSISVGTHAIPGRPFGFAPNTEEKKVLLVFLRSF